jgi:hypothetical protein
MPSEKRNEKIIDSTSLQQNDTFHLLCEYWKLIDADHPTEKDVSFKNDDGVLFECGIVFMTDSTVLENPTGEMSYGKFNLKGNAIHVNFDNGRKAIYTIQRLHKDGLLLKRTENKHTSDLTYGATQTSWPDANKNPFSKENYKWTVKPKKPETDAEIKERVKESVQFYVYYFDGFIKGNADQIDFKGLPNCLNWYQGGITIQNEENLNKKWISCFYSKDQAYEGRQILQDAITKKYNWDQKETNWLKQTASVLQQIHDQM